MKQGVPVAIRAELWKKLLDVETLKSSKIFNYKVRRLYTLNFVEFVRISGSDRLRICIDFPVYIDCNIYLYLATN